MAGAVTLPIAATSGISATAEPSPADPGPSTAFVTHPSAALGAQAAPRPTTSGDDDTIRPTPETDADAGSKDIPAGEWRGQAWLDADDVADNTRDIRSVDAYTRPKPGRVLAVAKFQAAPTKADTSVVVYFGTLRDNQCTGTAFIVGPTKGGRGQWATIKNGQIDKSGPTRATAIGRRVLVDAQAPALKTKFQCAFADVTDNKGATVYDETSAIKLTTVPQTLFSLITGTPTHTGFVPGTTKALTARYSQELDIDYLEALKDVSAKFTPSAGVTVNKRLVQVGTVDYGDEKPAKITAKVKKAKQTTIRVTAAGDYGVDEFSYTLHPLGKPLSLGSSLVGKRMFAKEDCITPGGSNFCEKARTLWFVTKNKVFVADASGGALTKRPTCKSGCASYRYQPKAGTIVIGGKKGTIKGRYLTWAGNTYRPLATPAAGARWQTQKTTVYGAVNVGIAYDSLLLYTNGTFSKFTNFYPAGATKPSDDIPATVARQASTSAIREGNGRYEVLKGGVIRFTYKNGQKLTRTFGVETGADGRANPWDVGLVLSREDYNTYDCLSC